MKFTVILLAWYSLAVTGWYQYNKAENERTVLEYEKLLMETENRPPVEEDFDCVIEREWTYDQWVTDKPCPPGTDGPLCHMDESDYQ